MTQIKQQAVDMINRIPDESMVFVLGILKNVEAMTERREAGSELSDFFSLAGNIDIDEDSVNRFRSISTL